MRIASMAPGSLRAKSSTASWPSFATITLTPSASSRKRAISMFRSLSSAKRTVSPEMDSATTGWSSGPASLPGAISNGRCTSKVVPSPFTLFTVMVPPSLSTRLLVIDMPRPVPPYSERAVSRSCSKGSKMRSRNSGSMPIPVSRHLNSISAVASSQNTSLQVM